ncbi:MAG: flagellar biosynthetic protein FliR [Armatimonadetes bacterium]|nr:flagellar biosynthetic protein FliR [Armatimonadota bacterium]
MLELINRGSMLVVTHLPALARIMAMLAVAPGFSFRQVPAQVRVLLAFALALAVAPLVEVPASRLPPDPDAFVAILAGQVALGLLIGLVAALVLETVRYAGSFIELQAGLRAAQLMDPSQATPTTLLGHLYYFTAVVVFFDLKGHHLLLTFLVGSFRTLPLGLTQAPVGLSGLLTDLMAASFLLALGLALPVLAALLLTDLSFGLVARVVARFNIFFVSLPAKMGITMVGLALSAALLSHTLARLIALLTRDLLLFLP